MRNPNGYGTINKLSGNRRRPYRVRKTKYWTEEGKQVFETIGYYATRPEAMIALAEYNKNPWDIDVKTLTFHNVYELSDKVRKKGSKTNESVLKSAYKYCEPITQLNIKEIKTIHLQNIINEMDKSVATKKKVKQIFNQVYKYAIQNDIVEKNYAEFVTITDTVDEELKTKTNIFTHNEIKIILNSNDYYNKITAILIFTGYRIEELLQLKIKDIDLENNVLNWGMKTIAGKNRQVPISKHIKKLILEFYNEDNKYLLLNTKGNKVTYSTFRVPWKEQFPTHKLHDTRHTFASLMDSANVNKLSIKKIIGHASNDITDGTYTHKSLEELQEAMSQFDKFIDEKVCL